MNDDRLSALLILPIERDYVQKLNFDHIIAGFTSRKLEKFNFNQLFIFYLPITLFTILSFIFGLFSRNIELLRPGTLFAIMKGFCPQIRLKTPKKGLHRNLVLFSAGIWNLLVLTATFLSNLPDASS